MADTIFSSSEFIYPYKEIEFPGQHSDEVILFATREGKVMLTLRQIAVVMGAGMLAIMSYAIASQVIAVFSPSLASLVATITIGLSVAFGLIGVWWVSILWRKSIFIITTRRLTKFIHTTPWNRYQLSLSLDKIVDTGAYQKGFLQSLFKLGYFVARSSAGNIKNFKILNISFAEDLHNYVNKLLFTFNKDKEALDKFRPFIPHLKGEARDAFVAQFTPEYAKYKLIPEKAASTNHVDSTIDSSE